MTKKDKPYKDADDAFDYLGYSSAKSLKKYC